MSDKSTFQYTYSNGNDQQVLKIREKYLPQEERPLDALKALDTRVRKPANVFAYAYGSVSAIIMGAGMSLVMTDVGSHIGLESTMIPGITVGVVGMLLALLTYPIYKSILNRRKKKYGPEILKLSESIMNP